MRRYPTRVTILYSAWLLLVGCLVCSAGLGCTAAEQPSPPVVSPPGTTVEVLEPLTLTANARIPENDPAFASVDIHADRLVFHYKSTPSISLEPGNVVVGSTDLGYLRKVVAVMQPAPLTVEVTTKAAFLKEFISSGHFRVTQVPAADGWTEGDSIQKRTFPLAENTFNFFKSVGNPAFDCKLTGGATLSLTPTFSLAPKLILELDFDPGYYLLDGEMVYAKFAVEGTLTVGADLEAKGQVGASCTIDLIKELRARAGNPKLFKFWLPTVRFAIGPVPVVITHYLEPIVQAELSASLQLAALQASGRANFSLTAGTEYKDKKWHPIWQARRSGGVGISVDMTPADPPATITNKLSAGIGYSALVYSAVGPKIGLTVTGSLGGTATPATCGYAASSAAGVDVVYGAELQVPVLDERIWDVSGSANLVTVLLGEFTDKLPDPPFSCPDGGVDGGADATSDAASFDQATGDAKVDGRGDGLQRDHALDGWHGDARFDMPTVNDALVPADAGPCVHPTVVEDCVGGWCRIPAGCFVMGSQSSEPCRAANELEHVVRLTRAFEIQSTEVTQAQFSALMGQNPSWFGPANAGGCSTQCPVEFVTWHDAAAYCNALSTQAGLTPCYSCAGTCSDAPAYAGNSIQSCPGYRLPTEAEWEYSYRAGTTTAYYVPGAPLQPCLSFPLVNPVVATIGYYYANSAYQGTRRPHSVGKLAKNAWGLYDMAGNVEEWCHDRPGAPSSAPATDPVGTAQGNERALRGGSYFHQQSGLRAAARYGVIVDNPVPPAVSYVSDATGFRCVRTLP